MRTTCASPSQAALLLYHTPIDSGLEPAPSYSLCVVRPNAEPSGRVSWSWPWSFSALPPSFTISGVYAYLPPFPVAFPAGGYSARLAFASYAPPVPPMTIRVMLLPSAGPAVMTITDSTTYTIPQDSNITRVAIEFGVPAGTEYDGVYAPAVCWCCAVDYGRYAAPPVHTLD